MAVKRRKPKTNVSSRDEQEAVHDGGVITPGLPHTKPPALRTMAVWSAIVFVLGVAVMWNATKGLCCLLCTY